MTLLMKKTNTLLIAFFIGIFTANAQNFQWARSMGGPSDEIGNSIAVDSSGNVYTTGYFRGTIDFDPGPGTTNLTSAGSQDIFISKLDAAGNLIWAKSMGGISADWSNSIAVDVYGNIYITGYFQGTADFDPGTGTSNLTSAGVYDIFILKLDASVNFLWAKSMGNSGWDRAYSITVDVYGNVYTIGHFEATVDFDPGVGTSNFTSEGHWDIFISKLDSAGNFVWAKSMGGPDWDLGISIAIDGSGGVYSIGYYMATVDFDPGPGTSNLICAGSNDIFISKLDAAGNFLWAKSIGGTGSDWGFSIVMDSSDNVYTTGHFQGIVDFDPGAATVNLSSAGFADIFICKLNDSGNFVWAKNMGGGGDDMGFSLAVDGSGNTYTTGYFQGTIDFDPGPGITNLSSVGIADIFITKFDATGNFIWVKNIGTANSDFGLSIALDGSGYIYSTGFFQGTADFDIGSGTSNLTSAGAEDVFVLKLGTTPLSLTENGFGIPISVYPNPTNGNMSIDLGASFGEVTVIIRNQLGQDVLKSSLGFSSLFEVKIPGAAGLYFMEVSSGDKRAILKVVKE